MSKFVSANIGIYLETSNFLANFFLKIHHPSLYLMTEFLNSVDCFRLRQGEQSFGPRRTIVRAYANDGEDGSLSLPEWHLAPIPRALPPYRRHLLLLPAFLGVQVGCKFLGEVTPPRSTDAQRAQPHLGCRVQVVLFFLKNCFYRIKVRQ